MNENKRQMATKKTEAGKVQEGMPDWVAFTVLSIFVMPFWGASFGMAIHLFKFFSGIGG